MAFRDVFSRFSSTIAAASGNPLTFAAAVALILVWAISGPLFGFSETWQLVVNSATTIVTFLMVFVLQHTQNRDGEAEQAKPDNRFIGVEALTSEELRELRQTVSDAAERARTKIDRALALEKIGNAPVA